jgi:hypothetical protein
MARNIRDYKEVIQTLNMSETEFGKLWSTRKFQSMLQTEKRKWLDTSNTGARVRLKTAVAVEEALTHCLSPLTDDKSPLGSRVNLLKILANMGGLDTPEPANVSTGNTFRLEINYANGSAPVTLVMGDAPQDESPKNGRGGPTAGFRGNEDEGDVIEGALASAPDDDYSESKDDVSEGPMAHISLRFQGQPVEEL